MELEEVRLLVGIDAKQADAVEQRQLGDDGKSKCDAIDKELRLVVLVVVDREDETKWKNESKSKKNHQKFGGHRTQQSERRSRPSWWG